jgi:ABC-type glutathione transport system ATPase component
MLSPDIQQLLAEQTLTAPSLVQPQLQARGREIHGLSGSEDGRDGDLQPRLDLHQPDAAAAARKIQSGVRSLTDAASPAALRLAELTKIFGGTRAVDRVSLRIEPGSMVALLGPSGCGKTTTLRMIAGLIEPNAGEIFLDGAPIAASRCIAAISGCCFRTTRCSRT